MRLRISGMVFLTTLCALSLMVCMWLSLIHVLFLFRKVTHELQKKHEVVKTLEKKLHDFVLESTPSMLEKCLRNTCKIPSDITLQVRKITCTPCLCLEKDLERQGTQHWDIRARFQNQELAIRWVTPAVCGACQDTVVFLPTPILSWSLYP